MGIGLLVGQLSLIICFTIFTLNKYAKLKNQRPIVCLTTFFGWSFSFLIIIILPLDVAITFYKKCLNEEATAIENTLITTTLSEFEIEDHEGNESNNSFYCEEPKGFVEDHFLYTLWRIVYWGSQFLTWILLPMMQSYAKAGEFTVKGRLRYAFYANALYYCLYFTLLVFLLIYLVTKGVRLDFLSLKVLIVSASNTWGLFLLVILLGYGLIELPRHFWRAGIRGYRLKQAYFDIDKLSSEKSESDEAIQEAYRETKHALNLLKDTRSIAREKIKQIAARFPLEFLKQINSSEPSSAKDWSRQRSNSSQVDINTVTQDAYLVKLHRKVINTVQTFQRCNVQWRSTIEMAFYLEDVEMAEQMGKLPTKWAQINDGNLKRDQQRRNRSVFDNWKEHLRFCWHVIMQRPIFKCLAILFAFMTGLILWSECTFFIVHPQLSLAARLLNMAARGYHYKFIQIGTIAMILYLCICAYYTIFRLRIYRYYRLDPNGMTDENSLIFSAMLICRLTAPMCLNFLGMIHLDSAITKDRHQSINGKIVETQFTKLMGHLEIIPWLAEGINIYLPIVIVLLCMATWFRLGTHFLHTLGIDQFIEQDEMTLEMVQSGKALVNLERNRLNRISNREHRQESWRRGTTAADLSESEQQMQDLGPNSAGDNWHRSEEDLEFGRTSPLQQQQQGPQHERPRSNQEADDAVLINLTPQSFFDDL